MWPKQGLKLWTLLPCRFVSSGSRNVVVSKQMKLGWHSVGQNSSHHNPRIFTFGHSRRLSELSFEECFEWLGTVRSLATEHRIFQLEVQTKTLLYCLAWNAVKYQEKMQSNSKLTVTKRWYTVLKKQKKQVGNIMLFKSGFYSFCLCLHISHCLSSWWINVHITYCTHHFYSHF